MQTSEKWLMHDVSCAGEYFSNLETSGNSFLRADYILVDGITNSIKLASVLLIINFCRTKYDAKE